MKPPASFPASLAAALKAAGMSQSDLARAVGCSRSSISDYVSGCKLPRKGMMDRINAALGGANLSPVRPISVEEVARDYGASVNIVRRGLRGGQLSMLGVAIPSKNGGRCRYLIHPEKYKELVNANA